MSKIELKETVGCTKKFAIEIEQERLDAQVLVTVKTLKRDIQLPGFRKGKAPESMLLKRFAPSIRHEAVKDLIPTVLQELFDEENIKPVNEPDISDLEFEDSGPVKFAVAIEEVPEIDITGFEGLKVTKEIREIADTDVDNELERIRQMYAKQEDVERAVQSGDILVMNLQKLDESGVAIIGDKIDNHVVMLDGKSTPSPMFDEQIFGMNAGESKKVSFTYDESINNPDLVGTSESYDVEVLRVLENKVPDIDDEFVANLGDFKTVDAFKDATRTRLESQLSMQTERKLQSDLIENFVKEAPFEVPNSMVGRVIQSEIDQAKQRNPQSDFDDPEFKNQIRPDAVRAVQTFLIVDAVTDKQGIEVTKEETDESIAKFAVMAGMEAKEYRRRLIKEGGFEDFKRNLAQKKSYDWMIESAVITEEKPKDDAGESNIIIPGK